MIHAGYEGEDFGEKYLVHNRVTYMFLTNVKKCINPPDVTFKFVHFEVL